MMAMKTRQGASEMVRACLVERTLRLRLAGWFSRLLAVAWHEFNIIGTGLLFHHMVKTIIADSKGRPHVDLPHRAMIFLPVQGGFLLFTSCP